MTTCLALSDEDIALVLTSRNVNHAEMGRHLGLNRERIRSIRFGETFKDRCPDLERWKRYHARPTCTRCVNWRPLPAESPSCAFGFPEPTTESTYFARECLHYNPN